MWIRDHRTCVGLEHFRSEDFLKFLYQIIMSVDHVQNKKLKILDFFYFEQVLMDQTELNQGFTFTIVLLYWKI